MNKWEALGRLTRDPEVRYSQSGTAVARFSLAVDRRFAKEGEKQADFFNITAFGKLGEFAEKYLKKGTKIALVGRLQQDEYTNRDGQKVTTLGVIAEEIEFCESKKAQEEAKTDANGFMSIPDDLDSEELPFNF